MTAFDVINNSPYIAAFVVIVLASIICRAICFVWNRFWRHLTIRKHGYPPLHCDADGDRHLPDQED